MSIHVIPRAAAASATMMVLSPAGAGAQDAGVSSTNEPNLIAVVGRRLSVREVPPKGDEIRFDAEHRVRIQVLEVVFGKYPLKEMEFTSYVHIGPAAFEENEFGLVYVSRYKGRLIQQKYLFQTVHRTSDGRWASCGDPYAQVADVHRHGVKAEPISFNPPVTFDLGKNGWQQDVGSFASPFFRIENNIATCLMGNYPRELFQVMAEGYLKARGVFATVPAD